MPLEKYQDFLELSFNQFVIQSNPISLGQIMCGVWETKHYYCYAGPSLIRFRLKVNNKSK